MNENDFQFPQLDKLVNHFCMKVEQDELDEDFEKALFNFVSDIVADTVKICQK